MKVNIFKLIFFLIFFSCVPTNYKNMALSDPLKLIALRDSLKTPTDSRMDEALIIAYNNIGIEAFKRKDYKAAISSFSNSQKILNTDSLSSYYMFMALAHDKLNTGKKEFLWESIQNYYKASAVYPLKGEPFYFIGEAYLKIGDKDFDLIIESYEKALSLNLDSDFRMVVEDAKKEIMRRKDLLSNFWK